MSDALRDGHIPFAARVIEVEAPDEPAALRVAGPQVIETDRAGARGAGRPGNRCRCARAGAADRIAS